MYICMYVCMYSQARPRVQFCPSCPVGGGERLERRAELKKLHNREFVRSGFEPGDIYKYRITIT